MDKGGGRRFEENKERRGVTRLLNKLTIETAGIKEEAVEHL